MHGIKIKARVPTSPTHLWPHGWGFKGSEVNEYSSLGPHSQKKDFFLKKKKKHTITHVFISTRFWTVYSERIQTARVYTQSLVYTILRAVFKLPDMSCVYFNTIKE